MTSKARCYTRRFLALFLTCFLVLQVLLEKFPYIGTSLVIIRLPGFSGHPCLIDPACTREPPAHHPEYGLAPLVGIEPTQRQIESAGQKIGTCVGNRVFMPRPERDQKNVELTPIYTISQTIGTFGTTFDKTVASLFYAFLRVSTADSLCHLMPCQAVDKSQADNLAH